MIAVAIAGVQVVFVFRGLLLNYVHVLVQVLAAEVVPADPRILDGAEQETSGVPTYTAPLHYFNIAMTIARLL